jgi:hypothetical protein
MDTMIMGESVRILFQYEELMLMLYPDYITIRNNIAEKYEQLVQNMNNTKNEQSTPTNQSIIQYS